MSIIDGGTKQSKKYSVVYKEAKEHPCYGKLKYPHNDYFAVTDDSVWQKIPFVMIDDNGDGTISVKDPGFGMNHSVLPLSYITPENIQKICDYKPYALMGGLIRDYQVKTVPSILLQIKALFPEVYAKLIELRPDYANKIPDYKGRMAKLSTLNLDNGITLKGKKFVREGDYVVCEDWTSAFNPFDAKSVIVKVPIDGLVVKIENNDAVTEETEFVD